MEAIYLNVPGLPNCLFFVEEWTAFFCEKYHLFLDTLYNFN